MWIQTALASAVKPQAVVWTLDCVAYDFPPGEWGKAVRTAVPQSVNFTRSVPEQCYGFSQQRAIYDASGTKFV